MARISKYPILKEVYEKIFDLFLETFLQLRSKKRVANFFDEFLTPTEQIMLAKRMAISLLLAKNYNYQDISDILKVSNGTIAEVSMQYWYGKYLKSVALQLAEKDELKDFWLDVAEMVTSVG
ncbi:MAG: hypothetical protein UR98_C0001G0149, partial [Parcubacteria group bacterium GW2011_GWA1_36_12]